MLTSSTDSPTSIPDAQLSHKGRDLGALRKLTITALVVITALTALTSCQPRGETWDALARNPETGRPIQRNACTIKYKINTRSETADGRFVNGGGGFTDLLHMSIRSIGNMTGVHWVFDGYTNLSYDTAAGKEYAKNTGVLIEYRGPRTWSQPLPGKGPVYKGGVMWFSPNIVGIYYRHNDLGGLINLMAHELGHQYGLADVFQKTVNGVSSGDYTVKMGSINAPWNTGDKNGLAAMTIDSLATCKRQRR